MKILFLTMINIKTIHEKGIYQDLLREFIKNEHQIYIVAPTERRNKEKTSFQCEGNVNLLRIKTLNLQKTNIIEKGFATISLERIFTKAIKKYFSNVKFDLVIYSTPPITFANVVKYVKKRDGAKSYLLLKDIFPQNAVDLGMLQTTGLKGLLYKYFRAKEKKLFSLSDCIGCMSQANVNYVLKHNLEIPKEKVEICPNCMDIRDIRLSERECIEMRDKYGLPQDKKIFVYGGNLGKPQDVPFIIQCLKRCSEITNAYFVIAGSGTDRYLFEKYIAKETPSYVKLFGHLPKDEYDKMIACCDVGLIFLDHRFTIPNFPSRLLSYMQAGLPVLACTDVNTDIGEIIVKNEFGWWCESNDTLGFTKCVNAALRDNCRVLGERARGYLEREYSTTKACEIIMNAYQACLD